MKYTPGIMTGTMSGSAGAVVASHNRSGAYLRTRAIPTNPNSTRQQAVRSAFGTAIQAWTQTLTEAQRTAWGIYAENVPVLDALGNSINLSAQNMYVRTNTARINAGLASIAAAPTTYNTGEPVSSFESTTDSFLDSIGLSMGETTMDTTVRVVGGASDDGDMLIYLGPPRNQTVQFDKGPFQLCAVLELASAATFVAWSTVLTSLLSDNGTPTAGERRCIRFRNAYDDGRLSQDFMALAPVVEATA